MSAVWLLASRGQHRACADKQAMWANSTVACIKQIMEFLGELADRFKLSKATVDVLAAEKLDSETALAGLSNNIIDRLPQLKLGKKTALHVAATHLQAKAGGSPLVPVLPQQDNVPSVFSDDNSKASSTLDDIINGLRGLEIGCSKSGTTAVAARGEPLRIVDFVSSSLFPRKR